MPTSEELRLSRIRPKSGSLLVAGLLAVLLTRPAAADDRTPFSARQGLDLAQDAARVWSPDAELVYLENDEPVGDDGTAERWGYLFYSPATDESRGYTLRDGKVLEAADLEFDFSAPPLPDGWLDSGEILAVAEREAGREYCAAHGGRLSTMFLIRGAFHEKEPDRSTWTVLYTSATEPTLLVVVDAAEGKVVRKWKG
ncbi:MAG: hypothetical protein GY838_13885 [bacterium]|nr:hypothetical protein [bacterium]